MRPVDLPGESAMTATIDDLRDISSTTEQISSLILPSGLNEGCVKRSWSAGVENGRLILGVEC